MLIHITKYSPDNSCGKLFTKTVPKPQIIYQEVLYIFRRTHLSQYFSEVTPWWEIELRNSTLTVQGNLDRWTLVITPPIKANIKKCQSSEPE